MRSARRIARQLYDDEAFEPLAHAMAAYELAVIESELGDDLDAARELAREALETTPKELRHHPLTALGTIALRRGRHQEAVRYLEQAARAGLRPQGVRRLLVNQSSAFDPGRCDIDPREADGYPEPGIDQEMLDQLRRVAGLLTDLDRGGRSARTAPRS
jgi:tetratricopeptide (TPR) repeat protein